MKNYLFAVMTSAALSLAAPIKVQAQAATPPQNAASRPAARFVRILSPEVHADRTVTFRYSAPNASAVELSGQFLSKNLPLAKGEDGVWSVTTG